MLCADILKEYTLFSPHLITAYCYLAIYLHFFQHVRIVSCIINNVVGELLFAFFFLHQKSIYTHSCVNYSFHVVMNFCNKISVLLVIK